MMLPRRGYEPVDDGDEDEDSGTNYSSDDGNNNNNDDGEGERSALTAAAAAADLAEVPTPATAGTGSSTTSDDTDRAAEMCTGGAAAAAAAGEGGGDGGGDGNDDDVDDGRMAVRILDVRGQFYPLRVRPETTVGELKLMLVDATGVELARQRIIYGGKMLGDSDTLTSRKISDGSAVHLFQKPKVAASAGTPGASSTSSGGLSTAPAQQPGGLHEFPPVYVVRGRGGPGGGSGAPGGHAVWEVDGPRKQIRCLASFLLLVSVIQLLECLASMSAVMGSAGAATGGGNSGGGGSNTHTEIPDEYWVLVRGRSVASLMGVVVGVLGVRGAHSLSTQTLQMYYVGLVMCAIVSIVIRVEVLVDIIAGKIPFADGIGSPNSSDEHDPGEGDGGAGGGGGGAGGGGGQGEGPTAEEAQSSLYFAAFSAFLSVFVSGFVWLLCIRRVNAMRGQIYEHVDAWERLERGEDVEARVRGGGLMNAVSDPELEGRRRGNNVIV